VNDPAAVEQAVEGALVRLRAFGCVGTPAVRVFENGVAPAARVFRSMARVPLPAYEGYGRYAVGPVAELAAALPESGPAGRRAAAYLGRATPDLWLVALTCGGVQVGARGGTGTVMAGVFPWDDSAAVPAAPGDSFLGRAGWGTVSLPGGSAFTVYADDPRTGSLARMLAQAAVCRPRPTAPQPAWDDCPFARKLTDADFAEAIVLHYARCPEAVAIALEALGANAPDAAAWLHDLLGRRQLLPVRAAAEALLEGV
jgi:hypothetical protein